MDQKEIDKFTEDILKLNKDKSKVHEFLCACANAQSMVENKLTAETRRISTEAVMKNLFNVINGGS